MARDLPIAKHGRAGLCLRRELLALEIPLQSIMGRAGSGAPSVRYDRLRIRMQGGAHDAEG
jgi:hypothetical protein